MTDSERETRVEEIRKWKHDVSAQFLLSELDRVRAIALAHRNAAGLAGQERDAAIAELKNRPGRCEHETCQRFENHNGPHITDFKGIGWITEEGLAKDWQALHAALAQVKRLREALETGFMRYIDGRVMCFRCGAHWHGEHDPKTCEVAEALASTEPQAGHEVKT